MRDPNGSILDQLEDFRGVILRSLAGLAVTVIPGFFVAPYCLEYMVKIVCPEGMTLHYFTPLEPFYVQLQMGLVLGIAAASWWIFWQLASFAAPGLYKHEKSALLKFSFAAAFLFISGAAFSFYVVLPMVMKFSYSFATNGLQPVIGVGDFLSMSSMLILGFAVSFQFPIVLVLLAKMGLVTPETLSKRRPVVITVIFIVAAFLTPPDVISQLAMALPAWLLFEISLWWIKCTVKTREKEDRTEEHLISADDAAKSSDKGTGSRSGARKRRKIRPL